MRKIKMQRRPNSLWWKANDIRNIHTEVLDFLITNAVTYVDGSNYRLFYVTDEVYTLMIMRYSNYAKVIMSEKEDKRHA